MDTAQFIVTAAALLASLEFLVGRASRHRRARIRSIRGVRGAGTPGALRPWLEKTFPTVMRSGPAESSVDGSRRGVLQHMRDLLQVGFGQAQAWSTLGVVTDDRGIPLARSLAHALAADSGVHSADSAAHARAIVVACAVAHELGSPLAPTLAGVDRAIYDDRAASMERTVAMSGPAASARLLQLLPAVGVGLSFFLGANPLAWYVETLPGAVVATAGVTLVVVGRAWTAALISRARKG